ncbi:MAG: carboxypeptidase-like regulatory domain-containing protein [Methanomassiliicoccaceae archaeon]|nr:carboxypeptidase-like regulatory domain-containing protein [Methanomassiliicoccaceae archaeon]
MRIFRSARRLRTDKSGGIEGMPLYLMIIILTATLGTAVIIGWMGALELPDQIGSVHVDSDDIVLNSESRYTDSGYLRVYVTDQNGNGLAGATVVLSGCSVSTSTGGTVYGTTDAHGYVEFSDMHISLHGQNLGFITIHVSKPGYGSNSATKAAVIA